MLGFIGAGAMGGAILNGVLESGAYAASDVLVAEAHPQRAKALADQTGVGVAEGNVELVRGVGAGGTVILAVKPNVIGAVLDEIADVTGESGITLVSIAAGTSLATLHSYLWERQAVVRVMPNVAAQIGKSMSAICPNRHVSQEALASITAIFEAVGKVEVMAEKDFSAFAAIAGCSPAFTFEYIDALARGGVANGIPKAQAVRIAAQAVLGAASLILEKEESPADLADLVQSPGGTTVAGVVALEEAGFGRATVKGVQAAIDRDVELLGN
ncbi:MAG: pyrroline-5-carboxylate reductase [Ancrocorticia sp.]|uniref:pyrroline-5-carboxylate reductase n=1 Tax=Ancrocorticia sp. TaxID=2593684 RepID=UPI003F8E8BF8